MVVKTVRHVLLACLVVSLTARPALSAEVWPRLCAIIDGVILAVACCVIALAGPRRLRAGRHLRWPLALWLLALLIGNMLHGVDPHSLSEQLSLIAGPLLLCASATAWGRWRLRLVRGVLVMAGAISALGLWQYAVILPQLAAQSASAPADSSAAAIHQVAARQRAMGTFSLATLLAGFLGLALPLAFHAAGLRLFSGALRRVGWTTIALLIIAAWLLTKSIGGWVSLVLACLGAWLTRRGRLSTLLIGGFVLLALGAPMLAARSELWDPSHPHHPARNRLVYWDAAGELIRQHPLVGLGAGGFGRAYPFVTKAPELGVRHAHNTYLEVWTDWGLVGVVAWCWLTGTILWCARLAPPWLAVAVWVLPMHNLAEFSFYVPQVSLLWWALAGWSLRQDVEVVGQD